MSTKKTKLLGFLFLVFMVWVVFGNHQASTTTEASTQGTTEDTSKDTSKDSAMIYSLAAGYCIDKTDVRKYSDLMFLAAMFMTESR